MKPSTSFSRVLKDVAGTDIRHGRRFYQYTTASECNSVVVDVAVVVCIVGIVVYVGVVVCIDGVAVVFVVGSMIPLNATPAG